MIYNQFVLGNGFGRDAFRKQRTPSDWWKLIWANPAGFHQMAVTSSAEAVKALPMPSALAPAPISRKLATYFPAQEGEVSNTRIKNIFRCRLFIIE